ncbi:MAG: hypothetical protein JWP61_2829 [Friedmanniella sp.]|nr:hypothetical protein [Friedmanniella sp.]
MTSIPPGDLDQRFVLSAKPPVRALAIASGAALVGALLLVLSAVLDLPVVIAVIGAVVLAAGVALLVSALVLVARLRTTLVLGADQVTIVRGGETATLPWAQVGGVTLQGARLTLTGKDGAPGASVVNPRSSADPVFLSLLTAVQQRLDADRGYSPLI